MCIKSHSSVTVNYVKQQEDNLCSKATLLGNYQLLMSLDTYRNHFIILQSALDREDMLNYNAYCDINL